MDPKSSAEATRWSLQREVTQEARPELSGGVHSPKPAAVERRKASAPESAVRWQHLRAWRASHPSMRLRFAPFGAPPPSLFFEEAFS